jgi:hypothetical protein
MKLETINKAVLAYIAAAVVLTAAWSLAVSRYFIPRDMMKVQATVIDIEASAPSISGGGRQVNYFPTYRYVDETGAERTYESRDGFNRINGVLFEKKVGEKVDAYYEPGTDSLMIPGTGDWYILLAAPLIFALIPGVPLFALILWLISRRKAANRLTKQGK